MRRKSADFQIYPVTFSPQMHWVQHKTRQDEEKKSESSINHICTCARLGWRIHSISQTHPLIWTGHVISLSIHPTCSGHKFSFSRPGRPGQAAVLCGLCSLKLQPGPLNPAPESASAGLFLSFKGWHMLRRFNSSLHLSRYLPGGRDRTCNRSWWMWQWAIEAETERSN